jgi:DNA-binding helix-hairpin-helix protein with protein kinase domain
MSNSNSLSKGFAIFFLAKEEKMRSNSLAKWVSIFDKLAKMLAACAYMRAGYRARIHSCASCCSPADTPYDLHLSLSRGPSITV